LPEQLQLFAEYQFIAYGLILTFTLILFRQGSGGLLFLPPRFIRQTWLTAVEQQRQTAATSSKTNEPQFLKIQSVSVEINVQAITMRFGGLVALNSVSLDIQAGHITALVGPNGSGKSTLVNIIAGVFAPTAGQVFLQGTDVTAQSDVDMAKKGVVRTFQDPRLVPHFTVRENIMLGAHAMMHYTWLEAGLSMPRVRLQEAQALEQCNEILQLLDIEAVADQAVESLPYGYRRMTELGRALLARPKIILLDEPAAGLSDVEMTRLAEILVKLKHLGITVLLIEHHMDFLTGLVDEVVVLDSGSIIFKGDMLGMRQDPKVIAAYLGDDEVEHA
jgi:branched-chain amino acid transport system permease protein